jgi:rhodanese-related sulfurtransferase
MRSLGQTAAAFLLSIVLLSGCGTLPMDGSDSGDSMIPQDEGLPVNISPGKAAELHDEEQVAIVDVRENWEYEAGHVPDSILIPLGDLSERIDEVPRDRPVILICRSGNRSGQALRFLESEGFDNVHNLVGGITAWEAQGHPIER